MAEEMPKVLESGYGYKVFRKINSDKLNTLVMGKFRKPLFVNRWLREYNYRQNTDALQTRIECTHGELYHLGWHIFLNPDLAQQVVDWYENIADVAVYMVKYRYGHTFGLNSIPSNNLSDNKILCETIVAAEMLILPKQ
ncbi:hypothetical protein ACFL4H_00150 [Candidatus Neomarinimicrobiota bacterium]